MGELSTDAVLTEPRPQVLGVGLDAPVGAVPNHYGRVGRFRVIHRSACATGGRGNPLVLPDRSMQPAAGDPLRVLWTTTPIGPFPSSPAYLLVSFGDVQPIELPSSAGFLGCTLHVDPRKSNLFALMPRPGSVLTQDGGRVELNWTPPASFAGLEINMQLLAHAPDADGGWLFSPGLELWIGSGR